MILSQPAVAWIMIVQLSHIALEMPIVWHGLTMEIVACVLTTTASTTTCIVTLMLVVIQHKTRTYPANQIPNTMMENALSVNTMTFKTVKSVKWVTVPLVQMDLPVMELLHCQAMIIAQVVKHKEPISLRDLVAVDPALMKTIALPVLLQLAMTAMYIMTFASIDALLDISDQLYLMTEDIFNQALVSSVIMTAMNARMMDLVIAFNATLVSTL